MTIHHERWLRQLGVTLASIGGKILYRERRIKVDPLTTQQIQHLSDRVRWVANELDHIVERRRNLESLIRMENLIKR